MRSLGMKLLAFAAVAMLTAPVFAQSDNYGAKADVALELTPSKIFNSPLGKKMEFAKSPDSMPTPPNAPDFNTIQRVFVCLVAPESTEKIEAIQAGDKNDLQFFVRLEFSTAEAASKAMAEIMEDNAGKVEKNGKTYYSPPEQASMPEGTTMYLVDDKTVALTSAGFQGQTGAMPFTGGLATAWKTLPDSAVKLSIDGVNARGLVTSMIKDAKKNSGGNPIVDAVMDLFPTMDNINLSIDLASADLLKLNMTSSNEDKAGDINDGFKSLVTMSKPMAQQGLKMIEPMAPNATATFGKLVSGMDVNRSGTSVTMNIPRPEGFEDAVQEIVPVVQQMIGQMMFGGGMGGGGIEEAQPAAPGSGGR